MKRLDNGTFCGDKRIGRFLIAMVTFAAWLTTIGQRNK